MYFPVIYLSLTLSSKVVCQINALASVLDFADSSEFDTDKPNVLEKPLESMY